MHYYRLRRSWGFKFNLGVGSSIPSGGVFIIPFVNKPIYFVAALLIGSFITAILLSIVRPIAKEIPQDVKEDILDLNSIKINKHE